MYFLKRSLRICPIIFTVFICVCAKDERQNKTQITPTFVKADLIRSVSLDQNKTFHPISHFINDSRESVKRKDIPEFFPSTLLPSKIYKNISEDASNFGARFSFKLSPLLLGKIDFDSGFVPRVSSDQLVKDKINSENIPKNVSAISNLRTSNHSHFTPRTEPVSKNINKVIVKPNAKKNKRRLRETKVTDQLNLNEKKKSTLRNDIVITKIGKLSDLTRMLRASPEEILKNLSQTKVLFSNKSQSPKKPVDDIMSIFLPDQNRYKQGHQQHKIYFQLLELQGQQNGTKLLPEKNESKDLPQQQTSIQSPKKTQTKDETKHFKSNKKDQLNSNLSQEVEKFSSLINKIHEKRDQNEFNRNFNFLNGENEQDGENSAIVNLKNKANLLNDQIKIQTINPARLLYKNDPGKYKDCSIFLTIKIIR